MEPESQVSVFILAGGRAERLGDLADRPKPLLEVCGRPFLVHLLAALKAQGLRRITLLTGHGSGAFEAWLRDLARGVPRRPAPGAAAAAIPSDAELLEGLELRLLAEETPLGTGGALRRILPEMGETALVLNGDSYCEVDARELLALHRARGAALCLAAARIADASDFGRLELSAEGRVTGFLEKGAPGPAWINAGLYALDRRFLETALPPGPASLEREVLPDWVAREPSWALRAAGYFCDIGTPRRLAEARRSFPAARILAALA